MHSEIPINYHFVRQPIARSDRSIAGYELLVRADGSDLAYTVLNRATPEEVVEIDKDALELAIALAPGGIPHHCNLSIHTILDWGYFAILGRSLVDGVNPAMIVIEFNEEIAPDEAPLRWLTLIRDMGFPILLDDYGTFHSNSYALAELEPAGIKIEGEIVKKLNKKINSGIIEKQLMLCKEQGMLCVAEHVENAVILERLEAIALRVGFEGLLYQGWEIGRGEKTEKGPQSP